MNTGLGSFATSRALSAAGDKQIGSRRREAGLEEMEVSLEYKVPKEGRLTQSCILVCSGMHMASQGLRKYLFNK